MASTYIEYKSLFFLVNIRPNISHGFLYYDFEEPKILIDIFDMNKSKKSKKNKIIKVEI